MSQLVALSKGTSPGEKLVMWDLGIWLGHTPGGSVQQRKKCVITNFNTLHMLTLWGGVISMKR